MGGSPAQSTATLVGGPASTPSSRGSASYTTEGGISAMETPYQRPGGSRVAPQSLQSFGESCVPGFPQPAGCTPAAGARAAGVYRCCPHCGTPASGDARSPPAPTTTPPTRPSQHPPPRPAPAAAPAASAPGHDRGAPPFLISPSRSSPSVLAALAESRAFSGSPPRSCFSDAAWDYALWRSRGAILSPARDAASGGVPPAWGPGGVPEAALARQAWGPAAAALERLGEAAERRLPATTASAAPPAAAPRRLTFSEQ